MHVPSASDPACTSLLHVMLQSSSQALHSPAIEKMQFLVLGGQELGVVLHRTNPAVKVVSPSLLGACNVRMYHLLRQHMCRVHAPMPRSCGSHEVRLTGSSGVSHGPGACVLSSCGVTDVCILTLMDSCDDGGACTASINAALTRACRHRKVGCRLSTMACVYVDRVQVNENECPAGSVRVPLANGMPSSSCGLLSTFCHHCMHVVKFVRFGTVTQLLWDADDQGLFSLCSLAIPRPLGRPHRDNPHNAQCVCLHATALG